MSTAFVTSCGIRDTNVNMKTQSSNVYSSKWNAFADVVGLAHLEDMPDATDRHALEKSLSTPPSHFQADPRATLDHPDLKYAQVFADVKSEILSQEPHMHALQIMSIEPYVDALKSYQPHIQNEDVALSLPYKQRNGVTVDLSGNKTFSSLDANSSFKVYPTEHGAAVLDDSRAARGHVYLMTYKAGPQGSSQIYRALISIPEGTSSTNPHPLMVFAHGGDAGLTFKEMALLLQDNLGKFVVAAPAYPGEPICAGGMTQGTEANHYHRSCTDALGNPTEDSIAPLGARSPLKDDVNGLLALVDGITKLSADDVISDFYSGNENIFKDNSGSLIPFNDPDKVLGLKTVGVADSRGGATLLSAVGKAGFLFPITGAAPAYFSGIGLIGSPSSLVVGAFRILLQDFFDGAVPNDFNSLPMVPELQHDFDAYRNAPIGSQEEQVELHKLVGWLASSDLTFLAPYAGIALKNWTALGQNHFAPGTVALFHGTQDKVVPFTESLIAKQAFDSFFAYVYGPSEKEELEKVLHTIPPGSQMFSFQSDASYVTDPTATYHVMSPSFMTSRLMNPSMQAYTQLSDMKDGFLYGWNLDTPSSDPTTVAQQFDLFNKAYQNNVNPAVSPYILSPNCNPTISPYLSNGSCSLYGLQVHQNWSAPNKPLYNRTILQDVNHGVPTPMYSGVWDPHAQNSVLSPADVFSAWLDTSVLDPSVGVLQGF